MASCGDHLYIYEDVERDFFIHYCVWLDPILPTGDDNDEDFPEFTPEDLEYCRKVRESQGFDLDMDLEQMEKVHIPFKICPFEIDGEGWTTLHRLVSHVLRELKKKKGTELKPAGIRKCNVQRVPDGIRYFITFNAKDSKDHVLGSKVYQSRVFVVRDGDEDIIVTEVFRLRPSSPSSCSLLYPTPPPSSSLGLSAPAPSSSLGLSAPAPSSSLGLSTIPCLGFDLSAPAPSFSLGLSAPAPSSSLGLSTIPCLGFNLSAHTTN